jgi:hypothetical protein
MAWFKRELSDSSHYAQNLWHNFVTMDIASRPHFGAQIPDGLLSIYRWYWIILNYYFWIFHEPGVPVGDQLERFILLPRDFHF